MTKVTYKPGCAGTGPRFSCPPVLVSPTLMTVSACPSGMWAPHLRNHQEGSREAHLELGLGVDLRAFWPGVSPDPRGCHSQISSGPLAEPSQHGVSRDDPGPLRQPTEQRHRLPCPYTWGGLVVVGCLLGSHPVLFKKLDCQLGKLRPFLSRVTLGCRLGDLSGSSCS